MKKASQHINNLSKYLDNLSGKCFNYSENSYSRLDNKSMKAIMQDVAGTNGDVVFRSISGGLEIISRSLSALGL